jgi:hypothetical protein
VDAEGKLTPSDEFVKISLEYLPDFSEEYSIHVRSGVGIANVGIKLDEGWKLTEISQELDSQTDENITAAAEMTRALTEAFSQTSGNAPQPAAAGKQNMKFTVRATNVPIGYYEAVIGRDQCGNKMLLGWKYVGFSPFGACCLATCQNPDPTVYGLVFESGVMVFKDVTSIHPGDPGRATVGTGDFEVTFNAPAEGAEGLKQFIEALPEVSGQNGKVTILQGNPPQVSVNLPETIDQDVIDRVKMAIIKAFVDHPDTARFGIDPQNIAVNGKPAVMGLMPPAPRFEIFR